MFLIDNMKSSLNYNSLKSTLDSKSRVKSLEVWKNNKLEWYSFLTSVNDNIQRILKSTKYIIKTKLFPNLKMLFVDSNNSRYIRLILLFLSNSVVPIIF